MNPILERVGMTTCSGIDSHRRRVSLYSAYVITKALRDPSAHYEERSLEQAGWAGLGSRVYV